jgi:hypothetical protein
MYFDEAQDAPPVTAHLDMGVLLSANGLLCCCSILPGPLVQLCFYSIKAL